MNLFRLMLDLEQDNYIHEARILILLNAFGEVGAGSIDGLTKLAKLDFFLRYPVYLERALKIKNQSLKGLNIEEHERTSIESKMVRFRYGPWDYRYRAILNELAGRGLAKLSIEGRSVVVSITDSGKVVANRMQEEEIYTDLVNRSQIIRRHFDQQGTTLMRFIYQNFPEIVDLRIGESIDQ